MTSRHRRLTGLGIFLGAALLLVLLWNWNWFKPIAESRASAALNRKVTIGNLDVKLGLHPWIILDDVVVANPPEMTEGTLASVGQLSVHINPWPLFKGKVVLPDLIVDRLRGDLRPAPSGKGNWVLDLPASDPGKRSADVDIGTLSIIDGSTHVLDPGRKAELRVLLHTENAQGGDKAKVIVSTEGTYAAQPIEATLVGEALLSLRDPSDPYHLEVTASNGATKIKLHGSLLDPLHFRGADVTLELVGNDLSELYPLTNIPLPATPPYRLNGKLDYTERQIRFTDFKGTVGSSDLSGDVLYSPRPTRPDITVNMVSKKVLLADLAGFIGATPGKADATSDTKQLKRERKQQDEKPGLLPDQPINLPKLRGADLHVNYKAESIETENTPFDNIIAVLDVVDGKLTLKPLSFGIGGGKIVMNIAMDGQQDQVHTVADIDFRKLDLGHILNKTTAFHGAGTIGGKARIDGTGNSLKTMLGRGDGELKLFMTGGDVTSLLIDLAGLDLGNAVLSAIGIPRRAELRCMVADLDLKDGQVDTRTLLLDTTEANVIGTGKIDLTDEKIDYTLRTEPKHFNIGSLPAPILIRGPLKSPSIAPDPKALAIRGGSAIVLGVFLTPLAVVIPTIQLGLGEDNDCVALLKTVDAPPSAPPPSTKGKGHEPAAKKSG